VLFESGQGARGDELAVRQLRQALANSVNAKEPFDVRIERRELVVGEGPIDPFHAACARLQFPVGKPRGNTAPCMEPSANLTASKPVERLSRRRAIGILTICYIEAAQRSGTGETPRLNGLSTGGEHDAIQEAETSRRRNREIASEFEASTGIKKEDAQTCFGQFFCREASGRAGAHDDRVEYDRRCWLGINRYSHRHDRRSLSHESSATSTGSSMQGRSATGNRDQDVDVSGHGIRLELLRQPASFNHGRNGHHDCGKQIRHQRFEARTQTRSRS
jgi:hypothetical protein